MLAGRKLLLADDSVTIQKVVDLTFGDEGMQVTTVGSGAKAIERLEEVSPDIVLADIHMPGMSGYEVCEHIKRDERFRHIPVMLLVGSFEPFDEAEARRVGADDYLSKPFQSIRQLVNKVGALLGRADPKEEATTRELTLPAALTEEEPAREVMNTEELERTTANTAPLPRAWQDEAHEAVAAATTVEPPAEQHTEDGARVEAALADRSSVQEDEMSESAPLEEFSNGAAESVEMAAPQVAADFSEAQMESPDRERLYDPMQETLTSFPAPEKSAMAVASAVGSGASMMGASMGRTHSLSDETLLDLDEVLPGRRVEEADDFILDLQDEAFTMDTGTLEEYSEELQQAAPVAEEFAEAQLAGEQSRADFALVEEAHTEAAAEAAVVTPEMEAPVAQTQHQPAAQESSLTAQAEPAAGQITLSQLSPEVIDAIARRAVEQISERVVEEVAWEVVPQLAELIIKRHLEREKAQTP